MNDQNAEYLKERLFYLGFGDKLNAELDKNIKAGKEQFQLPLQAEFTKGDKKEVVDYLIDFSKSKQQDVYFLNNYKATLKQGAEEKSQKFYINKGNGISAKEAYNLLDGRAVHKKLTNKEGNEYEAWLQLNPAKTENGNHKMHQYHSAWNFDVQKSLNKLPIKELQDTEQKEKLIKSLEKGNLQSVTFKRDDKEEKMFVEANPKEHSVNVYDAQMRKQFQGIKEHKGEKTDMKKGQSEKNQHAKDTTDEGEPGEKKSTGRKISR